MTLAAETESLFAIYERRRAELIAVARDQHEILVSLDIDKTQADGAKPAELLEELIRRLESERLRVLIIGRFSSGKSTFINALIGRQLLPASPTPTTGVLCEIRYADEAQKRAVLYPKPGMGPDEGSEPFAVTITDLGRQLEQYVKIDNRDAEKTSRYRKFELFWPLPLCQHGVDLIDSVGLDDPESRDFITLEHAASADAILYCMNSHAAYSAKDKQVIGYLHTLGYCSVFFVITCFDHIRDSAAMGEMPVEEFVATQRRNLLPWTELESDGIVFVDSKSALLGRMHGDEGKVADSGIEEVERNLQRFLTEEKGRAKLVTSLRALRNANRTVHSTVPARINLWQTDAAELERKYREAQVPLQTVETQRQLMLSKVEIAANDIAREARDLAGQHLLMLPDSIREWATSHEIQTGISFPPTKKHLEPAVVEVSQRVKELLEEDIALWVQNDLLPMVTARLAKLEEELEASARVFVQRIDEIRVQVSLGTDPNRIEHEDVSMIARIFGVGFALATGDFLSGGVGLFLGGKAMLRTLAIKVAALCTLYALGMFNPFTIVLAIIAAALIGGGWSLSKLSEMIKAKVGEAMAGEIVSRRDEIAASVEQAVAERLAEMKGALDKGLRDKIAAICGEVEGILAKHRRGQADANAEIRKLKAIEQTNLAVEERIDALMYEVGLKG
jgi:GTP-binding protein EngB required for normal cell division